VQQFVRRAAAKLFSLPSAEIPPAFPNTFFPTGLFVPKFIDFHGLKSGLILSKSISRRR
jgi:hypothetical protein